MPGVSVGGWGEVKGGRRRLKTADILLAESCRKQVSFESGFKQRKGRRIICVVRWSSYPEAYTKITRSCILIVLCFWLATIEDSVYVCASARAPV